MALKRIALVFAALLSFGCLWAKETVDTAISNASSDIIEKCGAGSILSIDNFESPAEKMSLYIRERLADCICGQDSGTRVVTRQRMDKVEKELLFQNSGVVSERTILSAAERLGAQFVVFGSLEEYKSCCVLRVQMLDVKRGSYLFRKNYEFQHSQKTEELLGRAPNFKRLAFGLYAEANKNSVESISPAVGFIFDYNFHRKFSVGARVLASFDLAQKENQVLSLEALAAFRWYIASFGGDSCAGFFAEVQVGGLFLFVNSKAKSTISAGACGGYRFALGNFFVEPELRLGYPYIFGVGLSAGMRF